MPDISPAAPAESSLAPLYADDQLATLLTPPFGVVVWKGHTTLAGIERIRELGLRLLDLSGPGAAMLTVVERTAEMPGSAARMMSAKVNDELAGLGLVAFAGVMPGTGFAAAVVRSVLTNLNLLSRHQAPFRLFASTHAALSWLCSAQFNRTTDCRSLARQIDAFRLEYAALGALAGQTCPKSA